MLASNMHYREVNVFTANLDGQRPAKKSYRSAENIHRSIHAKAIQYMYKRDIDVWKERVQSYKALVTYCIQTSSKPELIMKKLDELQAHEERSTGCELQIEQHLGELGLNDEEGKRYWGRVRIL